MPPPTLSYYHTSDGDPVPETEDLIRQVEQIHDPEVLKRMLIEKERERQDLASNLDLAARLGLGLQQQLEQVEMESYAKLQSLHDQNLVLQSKANRSKELSNQLAGSEHEVKTLTGHNHFLQRELDSCRRDLKAFRQELDELTEQMAEMGAEMMDAKIKVNSYARRLGEVEQELATTQELNVNLQVQLENALHRQKQTHSSTTQAVKLIQSDLGKVFSESDTMRITLEELESRQIKCEGKVFEMMTNTREYAQLLEEAQDTIHNLRLESDLEGRIWSRGPQAAIWDDKTGKDPKEELYPNGSDSRSDEGSLTRKAVLESKSRAEELRKQKKKLADARMHRSLLDPELLEDSEMDPDSWDEASASGTHVNSLGLELGRGLDSELARSESASDKDHSHHHGSPPMSPRYSVNNNTLSSELGIEEGSTFGEFAKNIKKESTLELLAADKEAYINASSDITNAFADDIDDLSPEELAPPTTTDTLSSSSSSTPSQFFSKVGHRSLGHLPQRLSLSAELHQRLEENNILQTVLTGANLPWNTHTTSFGENAQKRTSDSIRAEVNRTLQHHLHLAAAAPGSPKVARAGMSPLTSGSVSTSAAVGLEANRRSIHGGAAGGGLASSGSSSTGSLPGSVQAHSGHPPLTNRSRGSIVLENQSTLGLKYLLSAASSADLSNVITKTKAAKSGGAGSTLSMVSNPASVSASSLSSHPRQDGAVNIAPSVASRRISSPTHLASPTGKTASQKSNKDKTNVGPTSSSTPKPWSSSTPFTASGPPPPLQIRTSTGNRATSPGRVSPGRTSPSGRSIPIPSPGSGRERGGGGGARSVRGSSPSSPSVRQVAPNRASRPVSPSLQTGQGKSSISGRRSSLPTPSSAGTT